MRLRLMLLLAAAIVVASSVLAPADPVAANPLAAGVQAIRGSCALPVSLGRSHCNLWVLADANARPLAAATPSGYGPADLQSAYALATAASANGGSQTVAIVDAYDDSTAEADLGVYRSTYGLP